MKFTFKSGTWFYYWKILCMFGTTYVCESTFSSVNFLNSRYLSSSSNENLASELKCSISIKYTFDSKDLVWIKQC